MEKMNTEGLTDQEQNLQKTKEEYAIYVARIVKKKVTLTLNQMNPYTSFNYRLNFSLCERIA